MHIKFLKHGTGSIKKAVNYLIRERDHKNEKRPKIRVLRGSPNLIKKLESALKNKNKYSSAVIAFAPSDRPTEKQKLEVLSVFENVAFAGLAKDQYSFLAVDHGDHIHIIAPRIELKTGKSLNIAPPNWQKTYDPIRDYFNLKYDWKSPNIEKYPQNKRVAPAHQLELPKEAKKAKQMINDTLIEQIEMGIIKNRADIKSYLGQIGEITREGKDYLSVKPFGFKKAIRLKGAIFEEKFDIERIGEEDRGNKNQKYRRIQTSRAEELRRIREAVQRIANKRARYNVNRYKRSEGAYARDQERADADKQKALADPNIDRLVNTGRNYPTQDEATTGDDRKRSEIVAREKLQNSPNQEWVATDREKKGRIIDDGIGRYAIKAIGRIERSRRRSALKREDERGTINAIIDKNNRPKQPYYRGFEQYWEQRKREQRRRRFARAFGESFRQVERRLNELIWKIDRAIEELGARLKELEKRKETPPKIKPASGSKKSNFSGPKL